MKTKLLAILAIASVGMASAATAQTLGKSYIGAGYGEVKLDPKHASTEFADLYQIDINLPVIQNSDSGVDMGIEASRFDATGFKQTSFLLTGTYYVEAGDTFRPFIELGGGLLRQTDEENHPIFTGRVGGEFMPLDKLSIKAYAFYEDGEEMEYSWGLTTEANYWIIEQVGVFGFFRFEDADLGEAQYYGGGVRLSF